jgi:Icc-related predicted phosphoesterase
MKKSDPICFIYATDLHGNIPKYQKILEFALKYDIKLIHLGADILPKGSNLLKIQKKFIKGYLRNFYSECEGYGIRVLSFFGNDDIYTHKKHFREFADLLNEVPYEMGDYTFKAYPYVLDYPFGLKTACKRDFDGWKLADLYLSNPCDFNDSGYFLIEDIEKYFLLKGTIKGDLKDLHADDKTIMAMHMPPCLMGLDVCYGNRRVGSRSVFEWIVNEKPLLFLCGHIHESPDVSGVWKAMLGKTLVIQPGQKTDKATFVYIEIDGVEVNAQLVYR